MAKIILNEQEFDFDGYSRNTYFNDNTISSTGYIGNIQGANAANALAELGEDTITSISIKVDEDIIYNLTDIDARITSIDESFNGVDRVNTNINLQFN